MKTFYLISFIFLFQACTTINQKEAPQNGYSWNQAYTGGGGYITGIVQDPKNPQRIYARCDVAGVFKSQDGGRSWGAANKGLEKWYNHSVRSFTVSPVNHEVLFRCSGDKRNDILFGSIHKSKDGGQSWYEVSEEVGYYGNGPTRMYGELIAVDPFDGNIILTAGLEKGIWLSKDEGESWHYRAAKDKNFSCVGINPYHKNQYYAATRNGQLFYSSDKGEHWEIINQIDEENITELAFDKDDASVVYAATVKFVDVTASVGGGIYKSVDGGQSFKGIKNGLPEGYQFNTITVDPSNSKILYTAADARPDHDLASIPIYKSLDAGNTWKLINTHDWSNLTEYPSYIKSLPHAGWAISKVRVDINDPQKLFYSNWYGVAISHDQGLNWEANNFKGLETNCLENISIQGDKVYYTVADHSPMVSQDLGETYFSLPQTSFPSSTALVRSRFDSTFVIFGTRHKQEAGIFQLAGDSTLLLKTWDKTSYVQALREDPYEAGVFYAYIDGALENNAGLYISKNWGKGWKKMPLKLPDYIKTLPHFDEFIEDGLLNIVVGQRKNVVGADKLLCLDPSLKGTIYFGEWTEGIFRSKDGGETWKKINGTLPFHADTASVLTVIAADEARPSHIYAGFIREGLWRSKDYGESWQKVYPLDNSVFNVNDLHIGGVTGSSLYVAGENLYWAKSPITLMKSNDLGITWENLYDPSIGAIRIKAIDVDRKTGRIVLASSGNGAFFIEPRVDIDKN